MIPWAKLHTNVLPLLMPLAAWTGLAATISPVSSDAATNARTKRVDLRIFILPVWSRVSGGLFTDNPYSAKLLPRPKVSKTRAFLSIECPARRKSAGRATFFLSADECEDHFLHRRCAVGDRARQRQPVLRVARVRVNCSSLRLRHECRPGRVGRRRVARADVHGHRTANRRHVGEPARGLPGDRRAGVVDHRGV